MASYGESMDRLLTELARLPGVGRKTAERLAHHILRLSKEDALALALAIRDVKQRTASCSRCACITEEDPCAICADARRDPTTVCVVEQHRDLVAIEEAQAFRGLYHVLGGRVSPLDGVDPADLTIDRLVRRVRADSVREVILATSPDLEGDGTALYVERALAATGVRVTRISRGVPTGYALEHSSSAMIQDAIRGRRGLEAAPPHSSRLDGSEPDDSAADDAEPRDSEPGASEPGVARPGGSDH